MRPSQRSSPTGVQPRCLLRLWLGVAQNFALNVAEHGFKISVNNRSHDKVDTTVRRAQEELGDKVAKCFYEHEPDKLSGSGN